MQPTVTVSGQSISHPRHICCFFDSRDEQYEVLAPYIAEGLANGERVLTVMDEDGMDDHHRRLGATGIRVDEARESGHLCAFCTHETYLHGGAFSKARMMGLLVEALNSARDSGYTALRTCGDMTWLASNLHGTDEVLEYESEVNSLLDASGATFMCVYDINQVSAMSMRDIMNTHPHILMRGAIYRNMDYLRPADYTKSLIKRRSDPASG